MAISIFILFVIFVLALSFYFANRTKSAKGYFAAGGQIHWAVNGVSFAGDYLSAASFLGICGLIATVGYDGFLYSIGFLAGWIVALFVIAEPMKRLGKYTFTDALDSKFNSKGIQFAAALSTLIVSICYLIPQMVGAGVLVEPLLGLQHWVGVIMVGTIVIIIVATAGMASTTYVQFLKGTLLIIFSTVLVIAVCYRGLTTKPDQGGKVPFYKYQTLNVSVNGNNYSVNGYNVLDKKEINDIIFLKLSANGKNSWWKLEKENDKDVLKECQWVIKHFDGTQSINGKNPVDSTAKQESGKFQLFMKKYILKASQDVQLRQVGNLDIIKGDKSIQKTGPVSPWKLLSVVGDKKSIIKTWKSIKIKDGNDSVTIYYAKKISGNRIMRPGLKFKVEGTPFQKIDFISLMLALFFGTAALPHILIRYYTVPSQACARKSTIIAIASIGFFYILTLFMGIGAMVNNVVNPISNNMSAPLLARSFGNFLFAVISAIAFATVLGTVSGLIVAASGAIAHDLMDNFAGIKMDEKKKVFFGKFAAFGIGFVAIVLGILFRGMNVSFLVGWAFAVAASANLPALLMLLFWKKTTSKGIVASIIVGIISAIGLILISPSMYTKYGLNPADSPIPFSNPGLISIPLSFLTIVVVSLITQKKKHA